MPENGNNPSQIQFSDHEIEVINEIIIGLAVIIDKYINNYVTPEKRFDKVKNLDDSTMHWLLMLFGARTPEYDKGIFPEQMNKQLARILDRDYNTDYLNNPAMQVKLSRLRKELEAVEVLETIHGKKNIKKESPMSFPRKPKTGEPKRVGPPILYRTSKRVKDYMKILSNPKASTYITRMLLKFANLDKAYDLMSKNAFYFLNKGDENYYNIMAKYVEATYPEEIDKDQEANIRALSSIFQGHKEEIMEMIRKEFIRFLRENPTNLYLLLLVAKLIDQKAK